MSGPFTREMFAQPDDDAGILMEELGRALVIWTAMQMRAVTVHEASLAFNTSPEIIKEAIEDAHWISVMGDKIELDGE